MDGNVIMVNYNNIIRSNILETLRIDTEFNHGLETGVVSYWRDFLDVVVPVLHKFYKITYDEVPADMILSFHRRIDPQMKFGRDSNVVRILHTPGLQKFAELDHPIGKVINVTHYQQLVQRRGVYLFPNAKTHFMLMSVNTKKLPRPKLKNGKVLYLGNLVADKLVTYQALLDTGVEFDTISKNKLNGSMIIRDKKELFDIVSQYEIGIGVGRAALEMLAMGLKVIVAGRNYSEPINNELVLINQRNTNINSDMYIRSVDNFANDIKLLKESNYYVHPDVIDMRAQAVKYLNLLLDFNEWWTDGLTSS